MDNLKEIKRKLLLQAQLESRLHDHRNEENWQVIDSEQFKTSDTAKTENPNHHRITKVDYEECKECGEQRLKTKPLNSTKPKW